VRRAAAVVVPILGALMLTSCTDDAGDAAPEPTVTASPQGGKAPEEGVRAVLEAMGATGVGFVDTPAADEAFGYGQVAAGESVVVRTVETSRPTPGRTTDTVTVGATEVRVVRTDPFGVVARFGCGADVVDLWVRKGDEPLSQRREPVLRHAGAYIDAAGCA
jgi:hypothetical protein